MVLTLEAQGLRFAYPGGPPLLAGVGFTLRGGQVLCLLGPNGSGKTTLLRCVLGLETLAAGQLLLDGQALSELSPLQRARRMAYVPQASALAFPFTAFDVVLMGRSAHLRFMADPSAADRALARAALERLQVAHLEQRRFHELSGGERQLVLVARALAQQSPLLVMDEPCTGLDLGHQVQVLQALRSLVAERYAILMSTHDPAHAFALHAHVGLLSAGRWQGPVAAEALLDGPTLSRLYGTPVDLLVVGRGPAAGQRVVVPVMAPVMSMTPEDEHASTATPVAAEPVDADSSAGPRR